MFSECLKREIYFVGIGGVSMSALALLLHDNGYSVRGSDMKESCFTQQLRKRGIPVWIGDEEEIEEDTVVFTGAIDENHPQINAAKRAGKRLIPRAELLGTIAKEYPCVLSVAGCHGKTSTTSMLSHVFDCSNRAFTCHIGGEDTVFGNYYSCGNDVFLTEACEFKRSFLSLHSTVAIVLNCDRDHSDCYKTDEELLEAYRTFASQGKFVVVNEDDVRARDIPHTLSFGLNSGDIRAEKLSEAGERYAFTVVEKSIPIVRIKLNVAGKFQIYNALACFAAGRLCGLTAEEIKNGLERFYGVKRRFESVGAFHGVPVICDYAHHPREIAATLATAEKLCRGTVRLVFQPHTYTRTRDFMKDFVAVLNRAETPIIYKTFAAREQFDLEGSAVTLVSKLKHGRYVQSPEQLRNRLCENLEQEDMILVLGAGDIYDTIQKILD